ncbi:SapC family protein [Nitrincola iocasae]|uniref:SapC family protein n=1 Tax=Nitrincola iocasae TaxID=2614693 RepID=A0A5J6LEH0_9GAMM|nr:SapC family protein [Nitrincola iocasae]QEW06788.1 SapC family protein [Nitrincola iocasae]
MFKKLVPLNKEQHQPLRIQPINGFQFAADVHVAAVMVHEFARASAIYPIVFLEDPAQDKFYPVALLGLEQNENLFVTEEGRWQASYIPAVIRRYPFALARLGEDEMFTVCIDEGAELISTHEGKPLFSESGEPAEVIEQVKLYLGELQQMEVITETFCRFLKSHNLFTPLNMQVRVGNKVQNVTGCYVVNEQRFANLSDELFLQIRHQHYLAPIYAHLTSLSRTESLAMLKQGITSVSQPADDDQVH